MKRRSHLFISSTRCSSQQTQAIKLIFLLSACFSTVTNTYSFSLNDRLFRAHFRTEWRSNKSLTRVNAATRATAMSSKVNKGNNKGMSSVKSKNFKNKPAKFDVSASLTRLEKQYDNLMRQDSKRVSENEDGSEEDNEYSLVDIVTTEYVIAARDKTLKLVGDWVPISHLCLARTRSAAHTSEGAADPAIRAALSMYCRELSFVAAMGSRVFSSVPRHNLQYAVEPIDSFYRHVYDKIHKQTADNKSSLGSLDTESISMSKQQARAVLQISDDCVDPREIKNMYRKRAFACHPDRILDSSDDERQKAAKEYAQIQLAHDTLSSGVKNGVSQSWYASLGGRARTDFVGPIDLLPISEAEAALGTVQPAIMGIDPTVVQTFVARTRSTV